MSEYHYNPLLWTEILPGGHHWSGRIERGAVLDLKALAAHANVSLFCVNSEDKLEAYNMPDSLKGQHTAFLKSGHVLYSDLGRVMASIVKDDHGWNDTICAASRAEQMKENFGLRTFQDAHNDMYQSAMDGLLIEMAKYSLGQSDLSATLNLFSKVVPSSTGHLAYHSSDNTQQNIQLRFEMNCLVFLSAAPHALDRGEAYDPADIQLSLYQAKPLAEFDLCRDSCPQNQRAFQNNARYYALHSAVSHTGVAS